MPISGFGSAYAFTYENYANRVSKTSNTSDAEVSQNSQISQPLSPESVSYQENQQESSKAPKASNPEDFVFDFKQNNQYNLVAAQSEAEDIDVEKAISDMKKDTVLDQYKFFVKSSLVNNEDGNVRQVIRN